MLHIFFFLLDNDTVGTHMAGPRVAGGSRNHLVPHWTRSHCVCVQASPVDDAITTRTMLVTGKVTNWDSVDSAQCTFAVEVCAARLWPGREAFPQCAAKLIARCHFSTVRCTFQSLRLLAHSPPDDDGLEQRSRTGIVCGQLMDDKGCRRVLHRASRAVGAADARLMSGDVTVHRTLAVHSHTWVKYTFRLRDRRVPNRAAQAVRAGASLANTSPNRKVAVFAGAPALLLGRVRRAVEFEASPPTASRHDTTAHPGAEGAGTTAIFKGRTRRGRMVFDRTMPKTIPAPCNITAIFRHAVDHLNRRAHAMLTMAAAGDLRVWRDVSESASEGVRYYRLGVGTRKRLAAPYLRRATKQRTRAAVDAAGPTEHKTQPAADEAAKETAQRKRTLAFDALCEAFHMSRQTHLELDDGRERGVVIGVEFDSVASLRHAFLTDVDAPGADISSMPVDAGDGGPVRRRTMMDFKRSVSTPALRNGRTALIPLLFLVSGEQAIHSAVGERLRQRVSISLRTQFDVTAGIGVDSGRPRTAKLRQPYIVRLCGDFAMLSHILSLTGGGDSHNCPYFWPCLPPRYF